jgi:hypothetical protein
VAGLEKFHESLFKTVALELHNSIFR